MINILFCGNDKVFDGVLTTSLSIFKRTQTTEPFCIYIFTMDITRIKPEYIAIDDKKIKFLQDVAKKYNPQNIVKKIDVGDLYQKEFAHCKNEMAYCSPYTLLRLLCDLVPEMPDKLLYLDCDIMFNRDITELYDKDVQNVEYASSRDHYGKYFINPNYINAGVLLFNLKKMKQTKILQKARQILRDKKLLFADQSALYRATTKKLMLPQKFNDQKFLHKHTVVRHFSKRLFWLPYPHTQNIKQWHIFLVHKKFGYNQFDDILYEYIYLKEKLENQNADKIKDVDKNEQLGENNINEKFEKKQ